MSAIVATPLPSTRDACTCGREIAGYVGWAVTGYQNVPPDRHACDCAPVDIGVGEIHEPGCSSSGYTLRLLTCPDCNSTLAERIGEPEVS